MSRSPVALGNPWAASACAPTIRQSTPSCTRGLERVAEVLVEISVAHLDARPGPALRDGRNPGSGVPTSPMHPASCARPWRPAEPWWRSRRGLPQARPANGGRGSASRPSPPPGPCAQHRRPSRKSSILLSRVVSPRAGRIVRHFHTRGSVEFQAANRLNAAVRGVRATRRRSDPTLTREAAMASRRGSPHVQSYRAGGRTFG